MAKLLCSLVLVSGLYAQVGPSTVWIYGTPPGGVGGACTTGLPYGYLTSVGQVATCVSNVWTASSTSATGAAGGSLSGTYPNPGLNGATMTAGVLAPSANSGTAIQVTAANGTTVITNYDTTQGFLGVGNNTTLTAPLHVYRNANADVAVFQNANAGNRLKFSVDNVSGAMILQNRNTADSANLPLSLNSLGGHVLIGKSTDGSNALDVVGSILASTGITSTTTVTATTALSGATYATATNCTSSASPAVCGSAAAGSAVIAAGQTTVQVNTTAVTANSQIILTEDSSLGSKLSVTCNTQSLLVLGVPKVTARSAATSFTAAIEVGPTTNPLCFSYKVIN